MMDHIYFKTVMVGRVGTNRPFDHESILESQFAFSNCSEAGISTILGTSYVSNMNLKFIFKQTHTCLLQNENFTYILLF